MRKSAAAKLRRLQFLALEKLLLPLFIGPLMLVIMSWRKRGPQTDRFEELIQSPRAMLATCHGMFLQLLGFSQLTLRRGRRLVVLLSPSLDGRLLASFLRHFGIDHVRGTSGSRAVAGSVEFVRRIRAGDIGVIAVDGPRGPCGVAKEGFLALANAADAQVFLAMTSGAPGVRFRSWDRAQLPLPFALVTCSLAMLPKAKGSNQQALREAQELIAAHASRVGSRLSSHEMRSSAPR